MPRLALLCLVIALLAGGIGFGGLALGNEADARAVSVLFTAGYLLALVAGRRGRLPPT